MSIDMIGRRVSMHGGVNYSSEYVASYPHGVLAFRLSASDAGKLNVKLLLSQGQWVLSQAARVSRDGAAGGHTVALNANAASRLAL